MNGAIREYLRTETKAAVNNLQADPLSRTKVENSKLSLNVHELRTKVKVGIISMEDDVHCRLQELHSEAQKTDSKNDDLSRAFVLVLLLPTPMTPKSNHMLKFTMHASPNPSTRKRPILSSTICTTPPSIFHNLVCTHDYWNARPCERITYANASTLASSYIRHRTSS